MKKYKLTDETIQITRKGKEVILHRIEALQNFADVKAGDKGGFVESEKNLAHEGDCWVYDTAKVYDNAKVHGCAKVYGSAEVCGDTALFD